MKYKTKYSVKMLIVKDRNISMPTDFDLPLNVPIMFIQRSRRLGFKRLTRKTLRARPSIPNDQSSLL